MNVLILVGSTRPNSYNTLLADVAAAHLPEGCHVERFTRLAELPFYSEELDADPPAAVLALRDAIARADALVVVTPEYNSSIPALLKNAIDWASRPRGSACLAGKPVAVLGASPSPGATASAREHAIAILARAGAQPLPDSVGIGFAPTKLVDGELVDPESVAAVDALMRTVVGDRVPMLSR